ncbi:hypothetical protein CGLAMM_10180 [Acetobacteraceae bacterium EV16G]|uniref:gamma-glutamyltransferase n=1 Tax=Sorlinia euscelidii TaxID=3081148 RepID=UPI002F3A36CC
MMLRGIYRLQRDHGQIQFEDLMVPAITLAERGISVSPRLAEDLQAVHGALFADDAARSIFMRGEDTPLKKGDRLVQPRLARFLERTRRMGVGDFYNGALGTFFLTEANLAGGGLSRAAMRDALPAVQTPIRVQEKDHIVWFLPPPADGGLGAAVALRGQGRRRRLWRPGVQHRPRRPMRLPPKPGWIRRRIFRAHYRRFPHQHLLQSWIDPAEPWRAA